MSFKKILSAAIIVIAFVVSISAWKQSSKNTLDKTVYENSSVIKTIDNFSFRDLNKNGKLDMYEDSKQSIDARINDLVSQMNLEEKAGMMFINGAKVNDDGSINDKPGSGMFAFVPNALPLLTQKKMNHFNLWAVPSPQALGKWYNAMQKTTLK